MGANDNLIVIASRSLVTAAGIDDSDAAAIVLLHFTIGEAQLPQQFHPANFKPHKVVGMIDHAHLVRLCISHPHAGLTDRRTVVRSFAHSPLQRGLRFSRNEETPSRKSGVARIAAFSRTAR